MDRRTDQMMTGLSDRAGFLRQIVGLAVSNPAEVIDRMRNAFEWKWARRTDGQPPAYHADACWDDTLHRMLGTPWPCSVRAEFLALWVDVDRLLRNGGEGDPRFDADVGLARATWCLTRHLRPRCVVETGVARGVISRIVLEGMERNQSGHLWSIDLPALSWPARIGPAVASRLHHRWTYVRGSSRSRLAQVLKRVGPVDVFIHDSLHTEANLRFELETAWPSLGRHGVAVADDIDYNSAFYSFAARLSRAQVLIAPKEAREGSFGVIAKTVDSPQR